MDSLDLHCGVATQPDPTSRLHSELSALLDDAYEKILHGDIVTALRILSAPLSTLWCQVIGTSEEERVRQRCRNHPLHAMVQRDPYTNRAAVKPRGYAGDAVLMDYIYRNQLPDGTDDVGSGIFSIITRAFTSMSVRYRRQLLRSLIDDTAANVAAARMLSVASGHARELEGSLVTSSVFDGEFVALDQDPLSCAEIERHYSQYRVRTVNMGVIELLKGRHRELGSFDLIYSAGLYDYLSDTLSRRLTKTLLHMLRPGGRLLIANFVPRTQDRGYMELFMDWHLIFRNESQLRKLATDIGAGSIRSFMDPHRNVVYVEMSREAQAHSDAA